MVYFFTTLFDNLSSISPLDWGVILTVPSILLFSFLLAAGPIWYRKYKYAPGRLVRIVSNGKVRTIKKPLPSLEQLILEREENDIYGMASMDDVEIVPKEELKLLKLKQ